jgi:hypothetical protein
MDIEGILARYGIDIRDCPDRANLIAMYRSIERLEEQCFAMQQDIRRLNHEIYCLQERLTQTNLDKDDFWDTHKQVLESQDPQDAKDTWARNQAHAQEQPSQASQRLGVPGQSALREDFTPGAI